MDTSPSSPSSSSPTATCAGGPWRGWARLQFWRWSLAAQIIAGIIVGAAAGWVAEAYTSGTDPASVAARGQLLAWLDGVVVPVGSIFLRLIFMMILPLVLSAIVMGIVEMGDLRRLGRVGWRCLAATVFLAATGVAIGLLVVNVLQPGHTLSAEKREALRAQYASKAAETTATAEQARQQGAVATLVNVIPNNPVASASVFFTSADKGTALLSLMFFGLMVGIAIALNPAEKMAGLVQFFDGLFTVSLTIIGMAMYLAPLGVACLAFNTVARVGVEIVTTLGWYTLTVLLGLALHQFVTYPLVLWFLAGKNPREFFSQIREVMVTAFGTSSSNATLPVSMRVAEESLKLPRRIARFVLTVGASANQNGTALYEGVTVLFLAQVFGVELTLTQQVMVALMCIMAGIGTAGVPGGSLPLVVGVLVAIGLNGSEIAVIIGVDRVLDMCRTVLNVTGDLVIAVWVAQGEERDEAKAKAT